MSVVVFDENSPVLWGSSATERQDGGVDALVRIGDALQEVLSAGVDLDAICALRVEDVPHELARPRHRRRARRPARARARGGRRDRLRHHLLTCLAIARARDEAVSDATARWAHHETQFGYFARKFANIYLLVVDVRGRVQRALRRVGGRARAADDEQLLLALPPPDPGPAAPRRARDSAAAVENAGLNYLLERRESAGRLLGMLFRLLALALGCVLALLVLELGLRLVGYEGAGERKLARVRPKYGTVNADSWIFSFRIDPQRHQAVDLRGQLIPLHKFPEGERRVLFVGDSATGRGTRRSCRGTTSRRMRWSTSASWRPPSGSSPLRQRSRRGARTRCWPRGSSTRAAGSSSPVTISVGPRPCSRRRGRWSSR